MHNGRRRVAVLLNADSGDGAAETVQDLIEPAFREARQEVKTSLIRNGDDLRRALDAAIADRVDVIVAGGGDGTVNAVANAIVGHDIALGVLPLGTLNHFVHDLGIPTDVGAAAHVIVAGHAIRIDVGEVNGRIFVNNSSLGLYPRIVQLREQYHDYGPSKQLRTAWAAFRVTRKPHALRVRVDADGRDAVPTTPLIFIGNNEFRMAGFDAASRESLTGGELAIYVVEEAFAGRWALLRLVWRILLGTAIDTGALAMSTATSVTIDLPSRDAVHEVPVAVDGEVAMMALPLRYRIRPAELRVIVPASATN